MRYFLDTEFNGFGGGLISLALVREDGLPFYAIMHPDYMPIPTHEAPFTDTSEVGVLDEWVEENVVPILRDVPGDPAIIQELRPKEMAHALADYLLTDESEIVIEADWPEDIAHPCKALLVGPGRRVKTPPLAFVMNPVESYPTTLEGAVRHNAWWDAMALRQKVMRL